MQEKKISFFRSVLLTSLIAFILAELFFAGMYFFTINIVHFFQSILLELFPLDVESNKGIFNPIITISFILGLTLVSILLFIEISTIIAITVYDYFRDDNIPLKSLIGFVWDKVKKIGNYRYFPIFILILLFPKEHIGAGSIYTLSIPPFVLDAIYANPVYLTVFIIILLIIFYLIYRGIFIIHILLLENNNNFIKAYKKSTKLTKEIGLINMFKLILITIYYSLIILILIYSVFYVTSFITSVLFGNINTIQILIETSIIYLQNFLLITIPGVLFLATITLKYLQVTNFSESNFIKTFEFISAIPVTNKKEKGLLLAFSQLSIKLRMIIIFISILIVGVLGSLFIRIDEFQIQNLDLLSHRGDLHTNKSKDYVENTMFAIENAYKKGADIIEIDIFENKDGELYLSHDPNLKRVFGINMNISDMTSEEMDKIRLPDDSHIPRLEEVFIFAKENQVKLLVEPKIHGKEKNLYNALINLVKKHDMYDLVSIHTLSLPTALTFKKTDPDLEVGYTVFGVVGNLAVLPLDFYSVQETVISSSMIENIHAADKKVYARTVNDSKKLKKYIFKGVDGFITDEIEILQQSIADLRDEEKRKKQYYIQFFQFKFLLPRI